MSGVWKDELAETNFDNYMDKLAGPLPEPPKPDIETKLVDIAEEAEAPKTYVAQEGQQKPFEKRKEEGVKLSEPVNVYEPGFRSDVADALIKYFKDKRATRDRIEAIKKKMNWRS